MRKKYSVGLLSLTIALLSTSLGLVGCASEEIDENDPKAMYQEAEDDINSDRFQLAIDRLRQVKNRFPYSKFSVLAKLRIADVYFMQELYAEAAASYELFRDLHPRHPKVPYAMYRVARSYYLDTPDNVARDMNSGFRAETSYDDFLKKFPGSKLANDARNERQQIRERLAEKQLYVARFYEREEAYGSARLRYNKLIRLYPESKAAAKAREEVKELPTLIKEDQKKETDES